MNDLEVFNFKRVNTFTFLNSAEQLSFYDIIGSSHGKVWRGLKANL